MQNIIPPEWMAVLVAIGTVLGTIFLGMFSARRPPTPSEASPLHPSGLLFDSRSVRDLVDSINALTQVVQDGLTNICVILQNQKDAEQKDLLEEILEELKKAPQPPKTRMPPRA